MEVTGDLKLELVQIVFRHGARTCSQLEFDCISHPEYIDKSINDNYGKDQLTNTGKAQMHRFGCTLRSRYNNFLGQKYNPDEVYAYSSDHERTKSSLLLVLAGLYPPQSEQIWHPNLNWMPIPIHYVPREFDILLKGGENVKYKEYCEDLYDSPSFKEQKARMSELNQFFDKKFADELNKEPLGVIMAMFNLFCVNKMEKLPLPAFYTDEAFEHLKRHCLDFLDARTSTPQLKKYFIGPLIKKFLDNMNIKNHFNNPRKIYLYSGHELNLHAVLKCHNIEPIQYPEFGSAVILEKFRDSHNQLFVRLIYWTGSDDEQFINLKLNNKEFCTITEYLRIVENIIPTDEEISSMINAIKADLKDVFTTDFVYRPKYKMNE